MAGYGDGAGAGAAHRNYRGAPDSTFHPRRTRSLAAELDRALHRLRREASPDAAGMARRFASPAPLQPALAGVFERTSFCDRPLVLLHLRRALQNATRDDRRMRRSNRGRDCAAQAMETPVVG